MTRGMRNAAIMFLAFLAGACVRVGHIQQTAPIRSMNFPGDHKLVAQCVQGRLGGKVQEESFGQKYVIFGSTKGRRDDGFTHYAITVGSAGAGQGFAEWRIMTPPVVGPTSQMNKAPPLTDAAVRDFWTPVEECAARAKTPA